MLFPLYLVDLIPLQYFTSTPILQFSLDLNRKQRTRTRCIRTVPLYRTLRQDTHKHKHSSHYTLQGTLTILPNTCIVHLALHVCRHNSIKCNRRDRRWGCISPPHLLLPPLGVPEAPVLSLVRNALFTARRAARMAARSLRMPQALSPSIGRYFSFRNFKP